MTQEISVAPARSENAIWPNLVAFFILYAFAALALLHFLRPDYTPRSHMISDYAVGHFGWLMQSVFVAMSLGYLSLAIGLHRSGLRSLVARLAISLLVVVSIGLIVSAIFPTDLEESTVNTRTGNIHTVSFLINVGGSILVALLLPVAYWKHPGWRSFRVESVLWAALILIAFVIQFRTLHRGAPYGIANRAFVLVLFSWTLITASRLRTILIRPTPVPAAV